MRARLAALVLLFTALAALLARRAFVLQIVDGEHLRDLEEEQSSTNVQLAARPLLYTRARDGGVRRARRGDPALQERALAPGALDQGHPGLGKRHGQGQTRKSRPGADVGKRSRRADDVEPERSERIGHVDVDGPRGIAHRRRGGVVIANQLQETRETRALVVAEAVRAADLVQSRRPAQGRGA